MLNDKFLKLDEAADRLRLSKRTLRWWIAEGKLPATRVGRRWLVKESTVRLILEAGEVNKEALEPRK